MDVTVSAGVVEVVVSSDGLLAKVAHDSATRTHHLVAAVLLDEPLTALVALSAVS